MSAASIVDRSVHDATAESVLRHRSSERWVDASIELERWVASCRKQTPTFTLPMGTQGGTSQGPPTGMRMGAMISASKFAARGRSGRATMSNEDDDNSSYADYLRQRVPRLRLLVERESKEGTEQLVFVARVQKTNPIGKVQSRLIIVSDSAVYNCDCECKKMKRRIPLLAVGLVTASEHTGQFIVHVPSEYDYLYTAATRGYSILDDAVPPGTALDGILGSLQRAYSTQVARSAGMLPAGANMQLPVRTFNETGPLAALVKKKMGSSHGTNSSRDSMGDMSSPRLDEDEEDD